jgi:Ca2+-binding RTX toxin-like protein
MDTGDTINLTLAADSVNIDLSANSLKIDTDNDDDFSDETESKVYDFNVVDGSDHDDIIKGNSSAAITDTLKGGAGSDTFLASDGGDRIVGGEATDTEDTYDFSSMAATDTQAGAVVVMKDTGDSTASGVDIGSSTFVEIENIVGSNGHDTITGDSSVNTIKSGSGDDTIFGSNGKDYYDAGTGDNDWLSYNSVDTSTSTASAIHVDLSYNSNEGRIERNGFDDTDLTAKGFEHIWATDYADTIKGNNLANSILGKDGVDSIHGQAGADVIFGGLKGDKIWGEDDNDTIYGESDADTIFGGNGEDYIDGGAGNDKLYGKLTVADTNTDKDTIVGGAGVDTVFANDGNVVNIYDGGTYDDNDTDGVYSSGDTLDNDDHEAGDTIDLSRIAGKVNIDLDGETLKIGTNTNSSQVYDFNIVNGSAQDDTIKGNQDTGMKDTLYGQGGDDTFIITNGSDHVVGGANTADDYDTNTGDWYSFADMYENSDTSDGLEADDTGITVIMNEIGQASTASGVNVGTSTFDQIENIIGSNGVDTITGNSGMNSILSGTGADTIFGSDGRDYYNAGGANNDADDDWLHFNNVSVTSGIEVELNNNLIVKDGFGTNEDNETALGFENIWATNEKDILTGNNVENTIYGRDENDTIYAQGGSDTIYGGLNDDTIYGQDGDDELHGETNIDTVAGGKGDDTIYGEGGNDTLYGGNDGSDISEDDSKDTLYGGENVDRLYASNVSAASIYDGGSGGDNNDGANGDTLDLSRLTKKAYLDMSNGQEYLEIDLDNNNTWGDQTRSKVYDLNHVTGTAYNDTIKGHDSTDPGVHNLVGYDSIFGANGDDYFIVTDGADILRGVTIHKQMMHKVVVMLNQVMVIR